MFKSLVRAIRYLAALGGLAMISTREPEILFVLLFLGFFLIGFKVEQFPRLANILGKLQPVLALAFFVLAVLDFLYLSKSFLLTVAHFLLAIQGLALLTLRTPRENIGSVLVSSMLILSSCTLAVDWTFFLILSLFLPLVIWALMLYTLQEDPVAEGLPLYRSLQRACAAALLVAALCCAFVFAVFPRFNFQGFRGQFLQPVHKAGFTSQVSLNKTGRIQLDPTVVMRVEINPKDESQWTGYIRGATLNLFDGNVWRRNSVKPERIYRMGMEGDFQIPNLGGTSARRFKQSFYLESMDSPILFSVAHPMMLTIDRPFIERSADGTLQRGNSDSWRVHYNVESLVQKMGEIPEPSPRRRRIIESALDVKSSLDLPSRDYNRIKQLSQNLRGDARSPFDIATRLASGLRTKYQYTLDLGELKSGVDPIERFLFETRQGHCEYFATALCLMLRLSGIPARMVTGFQSQEWNKRGHYFVVRSEDAHAWVEAYIEPHGWIPFDPSPREARVGTAGGGGNWKEAWDYLNLRWNRYILSYDLQKQVAIFRSITQKSDGTSNRIEFFMNSLGKKFSKLGIRWPAFGKQTEDIPWKNALAGLALFVAALGLALAAIVGIRSRKNTDKVWFYRPLLRFLEKQGGRKPASQTLEEFSGQLEGSLAPVWPDVQFLEKLYYRLRFGSVDSLSLDEEARVKAALSHLK